MSVERIKACYRHVIINPVTKKTRGIYRELLGSIHVASVFSQRNLETIDRTIYHNPSHRIEMTSDWMELISLLEDNEKEKLKDIIHHTVDTPLEVASGGGDDSITDMGLFTLDEGEEVVNNMVENISGELARELLRRHPFMNMVLLYSLWRSGTALEHFDKEAQTNVTN